MLMLRMRVVLAEHSQYSEISGSHGDKCEDDEVG
jgi:hypothetical protein